MLNGVSGMVGETAVVTKELSGPHQPGSVMARGEEWFARSMLATESARVSTKSPENNADDRGTLLPFSIVSPRA